MRALAVAAALLLSAPVADAKSALLDARSAFDSLVPLRGDPGLAPLLVEAAVALGVDPARWPDAAHPALASLRPAGNGTLLEQVRSIHARAVAGRGTPADVQAIGATFHDGQFGDLALLNDDVWALRALRALGVGADEPTLHAAAGHLLAMQDESGGWSWRALGGPSSDVTGMALVALAEAKALTPDAGAAAVGYLAARHNATQGGYAEDAGAPNCDSTVWAIRGLHAAGAAVPADAWGYLAALHNADGGYAYQRGQPSNPLCTAEVATLLGEWSAEGRDLSGYLGTTNRAPGLALPLLCAGLLLAARRPPSRGSGDCGDFP